MYAFTYLFGQIILMTECPLPSSFCSSISCSSWYPACSTSCFTSCSTLSGWLVGAAPFPLSCVYVKFRSKIVHYQKHSFKVESKTTFPPKILTGNRPGRLASRSPSMMLNWPEWNRNVKFHLTRMKSRGKHCIHWTWTINGLAHVLSLGMHANANTCVKCCSSEQGQTFQLRALWLDIHVKKLSWVFLLKKYSNTYKKAWPFSQKDWIW